MSSGPSSVPRADHAPPIPESIIVSWAEVVVPQDGGDNPFGWTEPDPPVLNRQARRAIQRAAKRRQ